LTTVERDGSWYVSIGYSIAEAARRDANAPIPKFGEGVPAKGTGSPEDAVRALLEAGAAFDARRAIELVAPGEGASLHDYAGLFLPDVEAAAADARGSGFSASLKDLRLSAKTSGDTAIVTIDGFHIEWADNGDSGQVDYDGKCLKGRSGADEPSSTCDEPGANNDITRALFPQGFPKITFSTVKEDGAWFISPVRTWLDGVIEGLRPLDRKQLEDAAKSPDGNVDAMMGPLAWSPLGLLFFYSTFGVVGSADDGLSVESEVITGAETGADAALQCRQFVEGVNGDRGKSTGTTLDARVVCAGTDTAVLVPSKPGG
jgi:hypothetical protein